MYEFTGVENITIQSEFHTRDGNRIREIGDIYIFILSPLVFFSTVKLVRPKLWEHLFVIDHYIIDSYEY